MHISIVCDANWESKLDHVRKVIDMAEQEGDFGLGLQALVIVLNCRDPDLGHRQRVRHTRDDATLHVDVMLDLPWFVQASHVQRRAKVFEETVAQVSAVLHRRRLANLDSAGLVEHLRSTLDVQLNGPDSTRFDAFVLERATGF